MQLASIFTEYHHKQINVIEINPSASYFRDAESFSMNRAIHERSLMLLPYAFLIHNVEEGIGMKYSQLNHEMGFYPIALNKFIYGLVLVSVIGFIVTRRSIYRSREAYLNIIACFSGLLLVNVFIPHLILSIYLWKYTPGLLSALFINLPLSIASLLFVKRALALSSMALLKRIFTGTLIGALVAFLCLFLANLIF